MKEVAFVLGAGVVKHTALKAWLRLLKDRWRWLAKRWTFALLGFAAGLLWVAWLNAQTLGALWAQEEQLQNMNAQLNKLRSQVQEIQKTHAKDEKKLAGTAAQMPPNSLMHLPSNERQGVVWLQFSQLLAKHAVQLRSLRPVPDTLAAPLMSQAVVVRLHAKFDDWAAVWLAMNDSGPVWSIDRLRITPQNQGVDIDAVLRVWFGHDQDPSALLEAPSGSQLEAFDARRLPRVASAVFRQASTPIVLVSAQLGALTHASTFSRESAAPDAVKAVGAQKATVEGLHEVKLPTGLLTDPAQWPLANVRLLGVWQQAHDSHAILAAGPHWTSVRVGQRVAGHRVGQIHPQEVHLWPSHGAVKVLGLAKASP